MMGRLLKVAAPIVLLAAAGAGAYMLWGTKPEVAAKPGRELARAVAAVWSTRIGKFRLCLVLNSLATKKLSTEMPSTSALALFSSESESRNAQAWSSHKPENAAG